MERPAEIATGTAGAGAAMTAPNPEVLGTFLSTQGVGVLSYAEMIQIIGAVYVVMLMCRHISKWLKKGKKSA